MPRFYAVGIALETELARAKKRIIKASFFDERGGKTGPEGQTL